MSSAGCRPLMAVPAPSLPACPAVVACADLGCVRRTGLPASRNCPAPGEMQWRFTGVDALRPMRPLRVISEGRRIHSGCGNGFTDRWREALETAGTLSGGADRRCGLCVPERCHHHYPVFVTKVPESGARRRGTLMHRAVPPGSGSALTQIDRRSECSSPSWSW